MASDSASVAKVVIHLKSVGDAPVLRQQKFQVSGSDKFARVIEFLRRQLKKETLFVYINTSSFLPNPDELVSDLYNNFGIDGQLTLHYACTMAWG